MSDIGVKIGVEGEKEFKNALKEINSSFKVLKSEMNLVSSEFSKEDKSIQAVTARNQVLNKQIDEQKEKISTLQKALENASNCFGENDKRTQNWQIQLNNAKAALNGMESELKKNNDSLQNTEKGFESADKEADKFAKDIKSTANETDNAHNKFEKLSSALKGIGVAMGAATACIGTAAVAGGKKLYDMAQETAKAGDSIDKTSQKLGMSRAIFQEWDFVLSQNGMDIETLKTGMNKLNNVVDESIQGNKTAADKFARLGICIDQLKEKSREEIFNMTIKGLQGVKNESERAAIASSILGKSAVNLAPLLGQTAEQTEALKEEARQYGMVLSDNAVTASVAFTDSMDKLKRTFSGVKRTITAELLPGMTEVTDGLAGMLAGQAGASEIFQKGVTDIVNSLSFILPRIIEIIMALITSIAKIAPQIITALINGISSYLPKLIAAASNIIVTFLKSFVLALPQLADGALQLVIALSSGIISNLPLLLKAAMQVIAILLQVVAEETPNLISQVVGIIPVIVTELIDNLSLLLNAGLQLLMAILKGIVESIPILISKLPIIINTIVDCLIQSLPMLIDAGIQLFLALIQAIPPVVQALTDNLPKIINAIVTGLVASIDAIISGGVQLLMGLIDAIPIIIKTLIPQIPTIVMAIVSALIQNIPAVIKGGIQLLMGLISAIPTIVWELIKSGPQIVMGLVEGVMSAYSMVVDIGKNLIKGFWEGIKSMGDWLMRQISGFFDKICNGIKGFFGIHSPSTLFRDEFGKNLALGLGIGFVGEMNHVKKDMQSSLNSLMNGLGSVNSNLTLKSPELYVMGANNLNPQPAQFNQYNNIYSPSPLTPAETARISRNEMRKLIAGVRI